ncbi:PH domain-containing protein [Haladaptatus caseinilyticus]|uniref:PH domain-containing protein n=1 Tax=Haladaptatus caseinilyticus TaxID=2993314 RepID=UPI002E1E4F39
MEKNSDASWLHLTPEEEVLWMGHQSIYRILPVITAGFIVILLGIGLTGSNILGQARWLGVIFILVGCVIALPSILRWRFEWYVLTTEEIYHKRGIISTDVTQIRLDRIQNTACTQSLIERIFDYGDVTVYTAGSGTMDLVFSNISNPQSVNKLLTEQLGRVSIQ